MHIQFAFVYSRSLEYLQSACHACIARAALPLVCLLHSQLYIVRDRAILSVPTVYLTQCAQAQRRPELFIIDVSSFRTFEMWSFRASASASWRSISVAEPPAFLAGSSIKTIKLSMSIFFSAVQLGREIIYYYGLPARRTVQRRAAGLPPSRRQISL